MSGRVATVKQQACGPELRHGKHQYGVEVFLSHPMRADTRLAREKTCAVSIDAAGDAAWKMGRAEFGAFDNGVHDNQGD
jgi:hypothetical protein